MERDRKQQFVVVGDAILGAATLPFLLGTAAATAAAGMLGALGDASEEIFRGNRLPVLPFPTAESESRDEAIENDD